MLTYNIGIELQAHKDEDISHIIDLHKALANLSY